MADPVTLTGSELIWSYSTNLTTPAYKDVVCKKSASLNGTRNVTTEETDCGIYKAFGPSTYKIDFTGIVDITPDATEGSWTELLGLFDANTAILSKFATTGNEPYITGTSKISSLTLSADSPSAMVSFSATVEIYGTVDITP
jgi:hypothetical protein